MAAPPTDPTPNSLSVQLTEPIVFIRTSERRRSPGHAIPNPSSGSLVRGVVTLTLAKPTRISSIEAKLVARANTTWIKGAGPSRIQTSERYKVHSLSKTLFSAPSRRFSHNRPPQRATSALPPASRTSSSVPLDTPSFHTNPRRRSCDDVSIIHGHQGSAEPGQQPWREHADPPPPYHTFSSLDTSYASTSSSGARSPDRSGELAHRVPTIVSSSSDHLSELDEEASTTVSRCSSTEHPDISRGRSGSRSRFSLVSVAHVFEAIKEHAARSLSPLSHRGISPFDFHASEVQGSTRGRTAIGKGKQKVPPSPVLPNTSQGSRHDEGSTLEETSIHNIYDQGEWTVFNKGIYNYPVSFTLPPDAPPTIKSARGSLVWRLKAKVKRPGGTFRSNQLLIAHKDVEVVCTLTEDHTDEFPDVAPGIHLQRSWDNQLEFKIDVPQHRIPMGGKLPFELTIVPMAKIKVYQITVYLDERVAYFSHLGTRLETQPVCRTALLQLQHLPNTQPFNASKPILPLPSPNVQALRWSPLHAFVSSGQNEHDIALGYAGFGPWVLRCDLTVPAACEGLHASTPSANGEGAPENGLKSNVRVDHLLRVMVRFERGDGEDWPGPKKKLYDIVVSVPIRILSSMCTAERMALPLYSPQDNMSTWSLDTDTLGDLPRKVPRSSMSVDDVHRGSSRSRPSYLTTGSRGSSGRAPRSVSCSPNMKIAMGCGELYERLISGLESETGEAPPGYCRA